MAIVAALYVEKGGVYDQPGIDLWDETRDARRYNGPLPVVAHPPCARWCRLAGFVQSQWGYQIGDDGGCFEAALDAVRRWGGILEHPAETKAWPRFGLQIPTLGCWQRDMFDQAGGWVTEVCQAAYGHRAQKRTWLYYVGDQPPFALDWSRPAPLAKVGNFRFRAIGDQIRQGSLSHRRTSKKENKATPPTFAAMLIELARGSR